MVRQIVNFRIKTIWRWPSLDNDYAIQFDGLSPPDSKQRGKVSIRTVQRVQIATQLFYDFDSNAIKFFSYLFMD